MSPGAITREKGVGASAHDPAKCQAPWAVDVQEDVIAARTGLMATKGAATGGAKL